MTQTVFVQAQRSIGAVCAVWKGCTHLGFDLELATSSTRVSGGSPRPAFPWHTQERNNLISTSSKKALGQEHELIVNPIFLEESTP